MYGPLLTLLAHEQNCLLFVYKFTLPTVFFFFAPCSAVVGYQCFGGPCCLFWHEHDKVCKTGNLLNRKVGFEIFIQNSRKVGFEIFIQNSLFCWLRSEWCVCLQL
jgi:hypothetical protein